MNDNIEVNNSNSITESEVTSTSVPETKSVMTGKELLDLNITELPCLVEGIFPSSGLAVLAGASDTGKSSFLRSLAVSIARRDDSFLEWKLNLKHGKVIYVSTEDDQTAISYLLNKMSDATAESNDFLGNLIYIFDDGDAINKMNEVLKTTPVDCIIIDALTDLYNGDLNTSNAVRGFMNPFSQIAVKYECLVIFLHHVGKGKEENAPSKHNLLGSQGIEGKARVVVEFRRDPIDRTLRHFCIVKGNYISDTNKESSYALKFHDNLTFENTGERRPYNQFSSRDISSEKINEAIILKALALKGKGLSWEQITEEINKTDPSIRRATLYKYCREYEKQQSKFEDKPPIHMISPKK